VISRKWYALEDINPDYHQLRWRYEVAGLEAMEIQQKILEVAGINHIDMP
jgi:hypothetical protein